MRPPTRKQKFARASGATSLLHLEERPAFPRGLGQEKKTRSVDLAPKDSADLTAARSLASQIEGLRLPSVVAASPLKADLGRDPEPWMVRVTYTSEEVPVEIRTLANTKRVDWPEKTSSNKDVGRAFVRLGIVSALMWTGIAVAGGTALWWLLSSSENEPPSTSNTSK